MAGITLKKIIAVGGGKGGVGKSLVSTNLAIALAKRGHRTILADLDLGMANLHTLFGIDKPGHTLQAFIEHRIDSLDAALLPTAHPEVRLLAGSGAHLGAANIGHAQKQRLMNHLRKLDTDVLIIDVGAGMHFNTLDFFLMADARILVVTSQLTSLENAYAFLKVTLYRGFRNLASKPEQRRLFDEQQTGRELDVVHKLVATLRDADPAYAAVVDTFRNSFGLQLVGNMIHTPRDANAIHALSRMIKHFLALNSTVLATLNASKRMHHSVSLRRPLMLERHSDDNTLAFEGMARRLEDVGAWSLSSRAALPDNDAEAGLDLSAENADAALPTNLAVYQRRHERIRVSMDVTADVRDALHEGLLEEASVSGCLIVLPIALDISERLTIRLAPNDVRLAATVRNYRSDRGAYGVEFDALLPPAQFDALFQKVI